VTPVPIKNVYPQPCREKITAVKYGGGSHPVRLICGFLHLDQQFDPLLNSLPHMLCVRARNGTLTLETLSDAG
jgi:hypothetical protein